MKENTIGTSIMKVSIAQFAIYFALLTLIAVFSIIAKGFLSFNNLMNILRQVAVNGIAATGMTFVILTGGIDISVGSVIGLSGIGAATLMVNGVGAVPACLLMALAGLIVGLINGFFSYVINIPPMITTLSTMSIARGLAFIISGGLPVSRFPRSFTVLGQGYWGPVPIPVILMIVCFIIGWLILEKTTFGRYVYGVGSNREAARLSGINVGRVMLLVYGICGVLASFAGVVLLSRVNSGQPNAAETYEMDIITAVVMGGVSTTGGEGRIANVVVGLVFMGVLVNGMMMLNIPNYYQRVVKGIVLLLAISYDKLSQKRAARVS
jgi:ribose transport system permease protein